jgi:hypothetical protein
MPADGTLPVQSTQPDGIKAAAAAAAADAAAKAAGDAATVTITIDDVAAAAAPKLTETEELAVEMGWNPDREALGDAFVDAKVFIKRAQEIQRTQGRTIRDQTRKIDRMLTATKSLEAHYERVAAARQQEFDEKIANLKTERKAAIAENDPAKVDALDARIDTIKDAKAKDAATIAVAPDAAPDAILDDWVAANPWYKNDTPLRAYAHTRAKVYGLSEITDDAEYQATLNIIGSEVKEKYPDKFGKPARAKAPMGGVEAVSAAGANRGAGTKTFTRASLDDEHKKVYDSFVELGSNGQKIIEGWVATGEIA